MLPHICSLADAEHLGIGRTHENSRIPAKKSMLLPLTQAKKAENHQYSSQRIFVENVILWLKIFHILSERYSNRRKRFGLRFNLIAATQNHELNLNEH